MSSCHDTPPEQMSARSVVFCALLLLQVVPWEVRAAATRFERVYYTQVVYDAEVHEAREDQVSWLDLNYLAFCE